MEGRVLDVVVEVEVAGAKILRRFGRIVLYMGCLCIRMGGF